MKGALTVGIDQYPTSPLRGCVNDAAAIADVLATNADGSANFTVRKAMNVASQAGLKELIAELFEREMDTALFYFSGHGLQNETGAYIVTPDHRKNDEGVSMDEILVLASRSKIRNKIIILDCCHSGAFGAPQLLGGATAHIGEGMTILTASRGSEESIEVNGRGVFTNLLLDALRGGAADLLGQITPGSVYAYIDQALGPWDQRPVFKTNVSRFITLRTDKPAVPLEVLKQITVYFPTPDYEFPLAPSYEFMNERVANPDHVAIFKNLQKYNRVGLVVPIGEEHMYFAAQNSKSCRLTALGAHYWRLVHKKRI